MDNERQTQNKSLGEEILDADTLVGPSPKAVCEGDAPGSAMGCPGR